MTFETAARSTVVITHGRCTPRERCSATIVSLPFQSWAASLNARSEHGTWACVWSFDLETFPYRTRNHAPRCTRCRRSRTCHQPGSCGAPHNFREPRDLSVQPPFRNEQSYRSGRACRKPCRVGITTETSDEEQDLASVPRQLQGLCSGRERKGPGGHDHWRRTLGLPSASARSVSIDCGGAVRRPSASREAGRSARTAPATDPAISLRSILAHLAG